MRENSFASKRTIPLARKFLPLTFIQGQLFFFISSCAFQINCEISISNVYFFGRKSVELRGMDRSSIDDKYFRIREVNSTRIQIVLKESLDELVDNESPRNILKFRIQCTSGSNRRNHDVRPHKSLFITVICYYDLLTSTYLSFFSTAQADDDDDEDNFHNNFFSPLR